MKQFFYKRPANYYYCSNKQQPFLSESGPPRPASRTPAVPGLSFCPSLSLPVSHGFIQAAASPPPPQAPTWSLPGLLSFPSGRVFPPLLPARSKWTGRTRRRGEFSERKNKRRGGGRESGGRRREEEEEEKGERKEEGGGEIKEKRSGLKEVDAWGGTGL